MTTALFTHPACLLHDNGHGHPESPQRLEVILAELDKPAYAGLQRREAPAATIKQIARVHDGTYIDTILGCVPQQGHAQLDPDTALSPGSGEAALRAAGVVCVAIDEVMSGTIKNAFCAVRPPGHHAGHAAAMGFCVFNNIAVGAAHAQAAHSIKRIALVDFDVHHGNGTEEWAVAQPDVLFSSSHQFPLWPGSGHAEDRGHSTTLSTFPCRPEPVAADSAPSCKMPCCRKLRLSRRS
jgi:acetoin utilization deacetylase AcuC-like enzyme